MSQDDLNNVGGAVGAQDGAAHALPDDGMIHEWLDRELDAATSARFDALVQSSPVFAARVAEARGLVAASSRILLSLDGVPSGVLPASDSVSSAQFGEVTDSSHTVLGSQARGNRAATRGRGWARWGSIAALLMVGVTGVIVARREPVSLAETAAMSATSDVPSAPAAPDIAPATTAAREAFRSAVQSASGGGAKAVAESARVVPSPDLLPSPMSRTAERVATDPSLRPGLNPVAIDLARRAELVVAAAPAAPAAEAATAPAPAAAPATAAAPAQAPRSAVLGFSAADAASAGNIAPEFGTMQSDIARADLALAVQRVVCRPNCEQTRLEFASDGRVRRWRQAIGGGAPADTGRVTALEVGSLRALIDSLELASLPTMVRLDGRRCTTVGSLRESMRVEFRHEDTVRSVMGLPWCSDGNHPLDRVSNAAHALATQQLGPASRR